VNVIIFVRCIAARRVSSAIFHGGDKPPCATGWIALLSYSVNIRYSVFSLIFVMFSCNFQVVFSMPQVFLSSFVFSFGVVAPRHFVLNIVSAGHCPVTVAFVTNAVGPIFFLFVRVRRNVHFNCTQVFLLVYIHLRKTTFSVCSCTSCRLFGKCRSAQMVLPFIYNHRVPGWSLTNNHCD
jgi:hypothetical protein